MSERRMVERRDARKRRQEGERVPALRARDVRKERVTHQKRNVPSLPKEPQTPLQPSLPLQHFKSSPPSLAISSSYTMAASLSFSLRPSPLLTDASYHCCSSQAGLWCWMGMTQRADHGRCTSTAPPLFGANTHTHTGPRTPPPLFCQVSAKPRGKFQPCVVYQSYTAQLISILA